MSPVVSQKKTIPKRGNEDAKHMRDLVAFTAQTMKSPYPTPFGCEIVDTATGKRWVRRVNFCQQHCDPTQHAEVHAIRAACRKKKSLSLCGYTLYTTCEPCPMCMASALWAGVDRVVYGATIDDAARFCSQIYTYARAMPKKSDLKCVVTGPIERTACLTLFTAPPMKVVFRNWRHGK